MNLSTIINLTREDGGVDHRFTGLANEIVSMAGDECIKDLSHLYQYTNDAEARYEKAGLTLVTSFFKVEMEQWQRRTFLKRLRECLQEIGFKPSKVSKLITAGEFMASEVRQINNATNDWLEAEEAFEQNKREGIEYLISNGVTALYHLARMDWKGQAEVRTAYADNGMKPLSVRELEKLQTRYPARTRIVQSIKPSSTRKGLIAARRKNWSAPLSIQLKLLIGHPFTTIQRQWIC